LKLALLGLIPLQLFLSGQSRLIGSSLEFVPLLLLSESLHLGIGATFPFA
jgi:hypothetical protein